MAQDTSHLLLVEPSWSCWQSYQALCRQILELACFYSYSTIDIKGIMYLRVCFAICVPVLSMVILSSTTTSFITNEGLVLQNLNVH